MRGFLVRTLSRLLQAGAYIYFLGVGPAGAYFCYLYARSQGFSARLVLAPIMATIPAAVWPYYAAVGAMPTWGSRPIASAVSDRPTAGERPTTASYPTAPSSDSNTMAHAGSEVASSCARSPEQAQASYEEFLRVALPNLTDAQLRRGVALVGASIKVEGRGRELVANTVADRLAATWSKILEGKKKDSPADVALIQGALQDVEEFRSRFNALNRDYDAITIGEYKDRLDRLAAWIDPVGPGAEAFLKAFGATVATMPPATCARDVSESSAKQGFLAVVRFGLERKLDMDDLLALAAKGIERDLASKEALALELSQVPTDTDKPRQEQGSGGLP